MSDAGDKKIRVRQIKSGIGFSENQKRTLRALGLTKIGREVVHPDNPQVRGMVQTVTHLVEVTEDAQA
ncbi:50S ribosomal protein L30 [Acidobacteria bacterium Mor1]|nr:50S ribosomal protein L30 [Acidobacteria bacterium Mor1]